MLWPTPAQGCSCVQSACSRHAGDAVANAGAGGAAACGRHAVGMQAGHAGGLQAACRWGALWPTPAQGVQLRAVGMQSACRRHAGGAVASAGGAAACSGWPTPPQGVQLHAVGMQAGHAGGMAACRWGALCVAERGQRHAGGRQVKAKRPGPAEIAIQNSTKFG